MMEDKILTSETKNFLNILNNEFENERQKLLKQRVLKQSEITNSGGKCLQRPIECDGIRSDTQWKVKEIPMILRDRSVDIVCLDVTNYSTLVQCVKSGASGVQVDFDDGYSPTWSNNIQSQNNIKRIVNDSNLNGTTGSDNSLLIVRPRSMNLDEYNCNGIVNSGTIFDLGVFLFHNAKKLIELGRGPFLYIPKIENYKEAIWWNSLLKRCEQLLMLPVCSIKAIVLIENILASFEMEEIIYHLKDYVIALNTGRWDYIFSYIKKFGNLPQYNIPDKSQLGMNQDFLSSYYQLLANVSHKRGCLATGGMAPNYTTNSNGLTESELISIYNSKNVESSIGFDGALVAHTSAVQTCRKAFTDQQSTTDGANQINKSLPIELYYSRLSSICTMSSPSSDGYPTASTIDIKNYLFVLYNYIKHWIFIGKGAIEINGVIEDLATSEINRVLLWKWLKFGCKIVDKNNDLLSLPLIINIIESFDQHNDHDSLQHEKIKTIIITFLTSQEIIDFMPTILYPYLLLKKQIKL